MSSGSQFNSEDISARNFTETYQGSKSSLSHHSSFNGDEPELLTVRTSEKGDIVYLGRQAFKTEDLGNAFADSFSKHGAQRITKSMGNPVPLGLTGFSICFFVVGLINLQARGASNSGLLAGCALLLGGGITSICGILCFFIGETFVATALGAFGGFWMAYSFIIADVWAIRSSYTSIDEFNNVMGIYLSAWTIFGFMMWLCSFKSTYPDFCLFFWVFACTLLLCIGSFTGNVGVTKAGGVFNLLAALNGFYVIYSQIANHGNSYLVVPAPAVPRPFDV